MPHTDNFAIPYQSLRGSFALEPEGLVGEDGAIAVDTALTGIDVRVDALEAAAKFTKLGESILSGTAASVTFSSIPATYRALQLHVVCRSDTAAVSTNLITRFNGDSTANYDYQEAFGQQSSAGAVEQLAQTSIPIREMTGASAALANHPGSFFVNIPWYAGTTFVKLINGLSSWSQGNSTGHMITRKFNGKWRSTAAINQISMQPAAGLFIAGSSFALYGLP